MNQPRQFAGKTHTNHQTQAQAHYETKLRQRGYEIVGQIGRGGFGVVYKAKSVRAPQEEFAIKVNFDIVCRSTMLVEIVFYQLLKRKKGMPKIVDVFSIDENVHIVLQYFQHQSTAEIFYKTQCLADIAHYMLELLNGLKTLRSMGIFHRDIKPHNFLYNMQSKKGMIIDFGLAEVDNGFFSKLKHKYEEMRKTKPPKETLDYILKRETFFFYKKIVQANHYHGTSKVGTESYCPLETLLKAPGQGYECQIWSAGVIMLQFLTQRPHFFNSVHIQNGEDPVRYVNIFIMELVQLYGPEAVVEQCEKFDFKLKLPENCKQGDIREMLGKDFREDPAINQAYDLVNRMLQLDPEARISVEDAIMHPFFDPFREEHFNSKTSKEWVEKMLEERFVKAITKSCKKNEDIKTNSEPESHQNSFIPKITIEQPQSIAKKQPDFMPWPPLNPKDRSQQAEEDKEDSFEAIKREILRGCKARKRKRLSEKALNPVEEDKLPAQPAKDVFTDRIQPQNISVPPINQSSEIKAEEDKSPQVRSKQEEDMKICRPEDQESVQRSPAPQKEQERIRQAPMQLDSNEMKRKEAEERERRERTNALILKMVGEEVKKIGLKKALK